MPSGDELSPRSSKKPRPSLDVEKDPQYEEKETVKVMVQAAPAAAGSEPKPKSRTTFKALGNVVLAMQRFKASLNPTYTYGKQPASPSLTASLSHKSSRSTGGVGGAEHGEPAQTSKYAYADRGHRASLLLAPLPDVPKSDDLSDSPR